MTTLTPMRCNCESALCGLHDEGACEHDAQIPCQYVGAICEPCADRMRKTGGGQYLVPDTQQRAEWDEMETGEWYSADDVLTVTRLPDGRFAWDATWYERIIVGPYPGSPDAIEHNMGSGIVTTLAEAKWQAERAAARERIMQDAWDEAEAWAEEDRLYDEWEAAMVTGRTTDDE